MAAPLATSLTLLDRLRQPDEDAWRRFVGLYGPLLQTWLRRHGLQPADRDDLSQHVLTVVVRKLPDFRHNGRPGAFRAWLRTITARALRDFWAAQAPAAALLDQLDDPASDLSRQWDRDHDRHVLGRLCDLVAADFHPTTWQAFRLVALDGVAPDQAANQLGVTVNAVFIAKSRVLARLRQEGRELLDV
jgi:RNA polymerase sigma-70 factor (ECF subfamily)